MRNISLFTAKKMHAYTSTVYSKGMAHFGFSIQTRSWDSIIMAILILLHYLFTAKFCRNQARNGWSAMIIYLVLTNSYFQRYFNPCRQSNESSFYKQNISFVAFLYDVQLNWASRFVWKPTGDVNLQKAMMRDKTTFALKPLTGLNAVTKMLWWKTKPSTVEPVNSTTKAAKLRVVLTLWQ